MRNLLSTLTLTDNRQLDSWSNCLVASSPSNKFSPSSSPVSSGQRSGKLRGLVGQVAPAVLDPLGHVLHDGLDVDQLQ